MRWTWSRSTVLVCCLFTGMVSAQDIAVEENETAIAEEVQTEDPDEDATKDESGREEAEKAPPGRKRYLGRRIAQTMHYAGAPWLIRESREREEGCTKMLEQLGVKPGMTVCDMGCGNGFYALRLARMVGENGKVLGVDIQPEMLRLLKLRAKDAGVVDRIEPILGSLWDPQLPADKVDIILCADVYHEFSHPELMLAAMRKSLSPKGQVVLLEFREEDPKVPIKPLHKMSKKQVMKEMTHNGYALTREFDGLPWQHMMFFGKDESEK